MLSCNDAMVLTDKNGKIVHCNRQWVELTGYTLTDIEGKHILHFLHFILFISFSLFYSIYLSHLFYSIYLFYISFYLFYI